MCGEGKKGGRRGVRFFFLANTGGIVYGVLFQDHSQVFSTSAR